MKIMELKPERQKSYYGKAQLIVTESKILLQSYKTIVAEIENNVLKIYGWYSATTSKHIHDFCLLYGFKTPSKKEIEKAVKEIGCYIATL